MHETRNAATTKRNARRIPRTINQRQNTTPQSLNKRETCNFHFISSLASDGKLHLTRLANIHSGSMCTLPHATPGHGWPCVAKKSGKIDCPEITNSFANFQITPSTTQRECWTGRSIARTCNQVSFGRGAESNDSCSEKVFMRNWIRNPFR